ncbi:MAG: CBS domain-containing protein [Candidatus Dormibacteraeota bacterium]|nr:CBS domain-containing protein [Candidatus Dormibacteraeota bacterium]
MTSAVVTTRAETSTKDAVLLLTEKRISALPVVDEKGLVGTLCTDLASRGFIVVLAAVPISCSGRIPCPGGAGAAPVHAATAGLMTRAAGRGFRIVRAPASRPRPSSPAS